MNDIPGINLLPESIRGYALLFIAFFPYLTRAWHALREGGGLVGMKNAILFGTNTPSEKPTSNGSASKLPLILLVALLALPLAFSAGCKSSPQAVTYQAAATSSVTVEAALHAYNAFAAAGKTTVAQNQAVKAAFLKYQAAFAVVCDAGAIYAATGSTNGTGASAALQTAIVNANATLADLVNLIKTFGVKL